MKIFYKVAKKQNKTHRHITLRFQNHTISPFKKNFETHINFEQNILTITLITKFFLKNEM